MVSLRSSVATSAIATAAPVHLTPALAPAPHSTHCTERLRLGVRAGSGSLKLLLKIFLTVVSLFEARAVDTTAFTNWLGAQTNLHSWSADVVQTRTLKTLAQPLISTGRVWFAAPNQFRWELGRPAQTIAVRQTNEMLVIYPRLKRIERYPLAGTQNSQWRDMLALLEAGFPRSQTDLEARFKIASPTTALDAQQIILQPRSAAARRLMPQIQLTFSTNDLTLRATELQFTDGSTLRNEFQHPTLNPKLPDDTFAPKFGDDFKVVEPLKRP